MKMVKILSIISLLTVLPLATLVNGQQIQQTFDLDYNVENLMLDSNNEGLRLIQTEPSLMKWMTEEQVLGLIRRRINFMDITDYRTLGTCLKNFQKHEFPVTPTYENEVKPLIDILDTTYMRENLEKFTSFRNRYYRSKYGAESSQWLFEKIVSIAKGANYADSALKIKRFSHSWGQKSIIARFEGSNYTAKNEVVIIGAHQDSVNMWMPNFGRSPGADDDGSGTVTILEAFRVLVEGKFRPERPVEFHWYSAEEGGLLGSQAIAAEYEKEGREVIAMLQNDMTGYVGKKYPESFGIVADFVDLDLTKFIKTLISYYADIPVIDTKCGYACSDHASWRKAGYPSAFAIEGSFDDSNPYIHTTNDVIDHLSFEHMLQFAKLSVSFAIELSHI